MKHRSSDYKHAYSIFALLLVALMLLASACSAAPAASAPAQTEAPASTEAAPAPAEDASAQGDAASTLSSKAGAILGVSLFNRRSQGQLDLEAGLRSAAAELGFTLLIEDADTDPARQNEHIQSFIDKKVDLMIVNPTDPAKLSEKLLAADAAGIPVVTVEVEAPNCGVDAHFGFDYTEEGAQMAQWLGDYINANMGGTASIGVIDFASCKSICQVKLAQFEKDLSTICPGAVLTAKYDGQGKRAESMDACEKLLKNDPECNVLIVFNADAADGVRSILESSKKENVFIFGSAYGDAVFEALSQNDAYYKAFAADQYYQSGVDALKAADQLLNGETPEARTIYPAMLLSNESIGEYDYQAIAAKRKD